jgi:Bardet-Biedl syndrome 4 protein
MNMNMNLQVEFQHPASKNWLIHLHYVRREFNTCKSIIHEELQRLNGNSEYANYILVGKERRTGD